MDRSRPGRADRHQPGLVRTVRVHGAVSARLRGRTGHGPPPRRTRDVFPDTASFQGGRPGETHVQRGARQAPGTPTCALTRPSDAPVPARHSFSDPSPLSTRMAAPVAATERIGDLLLKEGLVTREQLEKALVEQKQNGTRIGYNLIKLGYLNELDLT